MELDVTALDHAREAWRAGHRGKLQSASLSAMTLGACLEAACWAATGDDDLRSFLERWAVLFPTMRAAVAGLTSEGQLSRPGDHDAPASELRRCPTRAEMEDPQVGVEWRYFLDRFRRSLRTRLNLSASTAFALAAVLDEMVDNVVEHAGLGDAPVGVVAYEVSGQHFGFGVADLGRGVLASLHENPAHVAIYSDTDALLAAVTQGASRRPGLKGLGFSDLISKLADMEGRLSFRSGSARLQIDGRGIGSRVATTSNSPKLKGFQLSVVAQPAKSSW
ncbi:ATP-binding protein [Sorangium sp. So ce764]|uniref:hypothetical protein n=1 Tax=Sorangium sp. So ce764 TaxID=3133320 RepID=UPI003F5EA65F